MMRFPVIFLDVDGVLNSRRWAIRKPPGGGLGIDPEAVTHLQRIIDETGCKLVLSSTWRLGTPIEKMRAQLVAAGMAAPVPLIGYTPEIRGEQYEGNRLIAIAATRGREVSAWIEANHFVGPYVCLDDEAHDLLPTHPLVQTTFHNGLLRDHADACISMLLKR